MEQSLPNPSLLKAAITLGSVSSFFPLTGLNKGRKNHLGACPEANPLEPLQYELELQIPALSSLTPQTDYLECLLLCLLPLSRAVAEMLLRLKK